MALAHQGADRFFRRRHILTFMYLHGNHADLARIGARCAHHAASRGPIGHENRVILILAHGILALARHDANHLKRRLANANLAPDGIFFGEEHLRHSRTQDHHLTPAGGFLR
jgi:hypothetical protein